MIMDHFTKQLCSSVFISQMIQVSCKSSQLPIISFIRTRGFENEQKKDDDEDDDDRKKSSFEIVVIT
jgi:hypothetical protein